MASRVTALILVGLLVVAGGCTGVDSSSPTTTTEQTDTYSPTTTPPQTSTGSTSTTETNRTSTTQVSDQTTAGISIEQDPDADSVLLTVRANTSLRSTDPEDENPGEPYFVIEVDGEEIHETSEVDRSPSGTYTFEVDSTHLRQSDSETVSLTVVLMDRDAVLDDEIRSWSTSVDSIADSTTTSPNGETEVLSTTPDQDDTTRTTATTRTITTTAEPTPTTTTPTPTTTSTETTATDSSQSSYTVTIVEIVDGDTADIRYQNGSTERVRFLGVDTPEVHTDNDPDEFEGVPDTEDGANCLRDWGHKASEFTRTELRGEQVTITFDENEGRRGSYGRLLVYIHHDGELFNHQLVAQGYARMYDSDFTKRSRFVSTESTAQQNNVGLWECTDAESTETTTASDSSSSSGNLSIAEIQADAPDNDHENLDQEYIVFQNTGDSTLDLSGWTLEDAKDHTYNFPNGFTLEPGETVTVYTGSGSNTDSELYWGSGRAVWNNGGDTIIVTDANGNVVIQKQY